VWLVLEQVLGSQIRRHRARRGADLERAVRQDEQDAYAKSSALGRGEAQGAAGVDADDVGIAGQGVR
jgi:hypothetical protein